VAGLPHIGAALRAIDLEQPRFQGMPSFTAHGPGYSFVLHRRHEDAYDPDARGARTGSSGFIMTPEHAGTHIDAISHQAEHLDLHGGIRAASLATPTGYTRLGAEEIPPILARGVLLDMAAHLGVDTVAPGTAIGAATLRACADRVGVTIGRGDVVLVRVGNGAHWNDPERYLAAAGVAADGSEWLAAAGVTAVGADNLAWDVLGRHDPAHGCELPGHLVLLVRNGIYIIENLALDELAASGHVTFTFVCASLKLVGATGAPARPLALVPAPSA
jgi:kynurenine formamidase